MSELDDEQRLSKFRGGRIDPSDDEVLNAIVVRAAREAEMPIALVSLVMDRVQFLPAAVGLPPELVFAKATNRCDSFCQFVVRTDDVFVVEDAPNDSRVPQDLVQRYGIASYAGAPLRVEGQVLGSLCVIDVKPRKFSESFLASLTNAATEASARLQAMVHSRSRLLARDTVTVTDPRATTAQLVSSLTTLLRAVEIGTPAMNDLAAIPREQWTEENLAAHRETLADAAAFYRSLASRLEQVTATADALGEKVRSATSDLLLSELSVVSRALAEGLSFVRVMEALESAAITTAESSRTLSVLHVALGFSQDMQNAMKQTLTAAEALEASLETQRGLP